ncbi:MAG: chemotaxis protein CheW [Proteobacteria bacterium]|nr:chemotaxis protein CheW [Pseudomonadota bacterium]
MISWLNFFNMQLLLFHVDDRRCALRLDEVEEVIAAVAHVPLPSAPQGIVGAIDVHGEPVPLFDVRSRLELPTRLPKSSDHFILSRSSGRRIALAVDRALEIADIPEIDMTKARQLAPCAPYLDGLAKQAMELWLIWDLSCFLSQSEKRALDEALAASLEVGGP